MVLVGRIARPHGLRGQVVINPETDFVEERFAEGATLWTRSTAGDEQLTVASMRVQNGRPMVGFEGFDADRGCRAARGTRAEGTRRDAAAAAAGHATTSISSLAAAVETVGGRRRRRGGEGRRRRWREPAGDERTAG